MNYKAPFIQELIDRAGDRCECMRRECHEAEGRCAAGLFEEPGGVARWRPVFTGDRQTATPIAADYMALCDTCAVPRNGRR